MKLPIDGLDVVLFGGAHLDRVARSSVPFQAAASNPGSCREFIGGASFNVARAMARQGAAPHVVSARGGDSIAASIEIALEAERIGDGALSWLDRRSASYTAILDDTGELRAAVADMDIYDLLTPRALKRAHLRHRLNAAQACVVDANLPSETLAYLSEHKMNGPIFAIAVSPSKVLRLRPCLPRLTALFLSRAEAASLAGRPKDSPVEHLAQALRELGLRRAVVTDGPRAAAILDEDGLVLQSPPQVPAIRDVTGAGDTLAAITILELVTGTNFTEAARVGMCASALHIAHELPPQSLPQCRSLAAALPSPTPVHQDRSA
ncbi:hypothetical protein NS365_22090 [Aureimonas ureilytica]|uniref:Carbohydrate kinase PfkB domain-containing protein n=1 Tax=Aureimonas ureilytica TaxID=401562 RepID=A0A175RHC0_9HYPH|nr:carbohydrate kinase family protein [Aureimonas ureilytica]KTR02229.1 hypothetical protein NS365_22090 [Aureimonas ureilytica]